MTKVSVFGQETQKKKGNPIQFVKLINRAGIAVKCQNCPETYQNVQLLYKGTKFDTMLVWDDGGEPTIFLGHWNDGFVE
jgi:hypothetical protein